MSLHPDFKDLLAAFAAEKVRYLLVGGYAVAYHGRPRFTKDIDLWIGPGDENTQRAARALALFGAPPHIVETMRNLGPEEVLFFGRPPSRVDVIRKLAGLDFDEVDSRGLDVEWDGIAVRVIALADLIASKQAAGRAQDLADIRVLSQAERAKRGQP